MDKNNELNPIEIIQDLRDCIEEVCTYGDKGKENWDWQAEIDQADRLIKQLLVKGTSKVHTLTDAEIEAMAEERYPKLCGGSRCDCKWCVERRANINAYTNGIKAILNILNK
jgi:hypothetical protein